MTERPKVCTMGLWHLGCVTSACLSELGYSVTGYDTDQALVDNLDKCVPPLFEPGLVGLIERNASAGRLSFTTDLTQALRGAQFVILTQDTPVDESDELELSWLREAVSAMALHLESSNVTLIVSSQVPVGTCEDLAARIRLADQALNVGIACVPENLRLGEAVNRFMNPDMIIIGADVASVHEKVKEFFADIPAPQLAMSLRTAEMTKHAINAFLATCISFSNEIADLCQDVGADAQLVARALGMEGRIGQGLPLRPGLGFAGGTLARDLRALVSAADRTGNQLILLQSVLEVNRQRNAVVTRMLHKTYDSIEGLTVGLLGLTYKAGTSTLRRSPALEIVSSLVTEGAIVRAFDPKADASEVKTRLNLELSLDPYVVARQADALVFLTDWPEFLDLDWPSIRREMRAPLLIDARNMLNADELRNLGFVYQGIGQGQE